MGRNILGHIYQIAADEVKFPVRTGHNPMRTMLAAVAAPFSDYFDRIILIVAVGVTEAIKGEAVFAFAVHVEAVEGTKQPHGAAHRQIDRLDFFDLTGFRNGDANHPRVGFLRGDNKTALVVHREADPGTFARFRGSDPFNFEAGQDGDFFRGRGLWPNKNITP